MLNNLGLGELPYKGSAEHLSNIFHSIIEKALNHKKPFTAEGDRGFKDALLLETALKFMCDKKEDTLLLFTRDKDFEGVETESCGVKICLISSEYDKEYQINKHITEALKSTA